MIRGLFALIAGGAAAIALVATAGAAKPQPIDLDCGSDGTYTVLVNGNGEWTPGRIVGGGVVHPVAFSNQHATFTDSEGNVFEEDEPDVSKANVPANKELIDCSFSVTGADEGGTFTFSGDVTAWISGR